MREFPADRGQERPRTAMGDEHERAIARHGDECSGNTRRLPPPIRCRGISGVLGRWDESTETTPPQFLGDRHPGIRPAEWAVDQGEMRRQRKVLPT